ncbi:MAG: hypothetical protein ACXWEY_12560 [Bacteroidia bacterium]
MSSAQFVTYRKFSDVNAALELGALLEKNDLEYLHEDTSASFDASFANNDLSKEYRIKLHKEDFEKADKILHEQASAEIEDLDEDYYLFEFTDEELIEVVLNRNDWSALDFVLAQKLLKERGKEVNPEVINQVEKQKIDALAKPEEDQKNLIAAGYIFAILGGLIGIFIGFHLYTQKKTLPDGRQVYAFSDHDRKEGERIFITGIIALIIWILVKIFR